MCIFVPSPLEDLSLNVADNTAVNMSTLAAARPGPRTASGAASTRDSSSSRSGVVRANGASSRARNADHSSIMVGGATSGRIVASLDAVCHHLNKTFLFRNPFPVQVPFLANPFHFLILLLLAFAGNIFSSRPEDRFSESRQDRGNVDRHGGFGGPNRPDLAYGQQYGLLQQQHGQQSGLGYRSDDSSRRGGDQEFSSYRRGGDRGDRF